MWIGFVYQTATTGRLYWTW